MEKSSFIQRGAWGPQILITLFVGAAACDDYNCADTATCTSTPNANQVEAGVDAGASTPRPSTTTGAPPVGTGENVEVTSDSDTRSTTTPETSAALDQEAPSSGSQSNVTANPTTDLRDGQSSSAASSSSAVETEFGSSSDVSGEPTPPSSTSESTTENVDATSDSFSPTSTGGSSSTAETCPSGSFDADPGVGLGCTPWTDCGWRPVVTTGTPTSDVICDGAEVVLRFGGTAGTWVMASAPDSSGNLVIGGATMGSLGANPLGMEDAFVRKLAATGEVLWTHQFGTTSNERITGIAVDASDNVIAVGYTQGKVGPSQYGAEDAFVMKLSPDGDVIWTWQHGSDKDERATGVAVNGERVYISGQSYGNVGAANAGSSDAFLFALNLDGALQWTRQWGTDKSDESAGVAVDAAGNVGVVGQTLGGIQGANAGSWDVYLRNFSSAGDVRWTRQFGTAGGDLSRSIVATGNQLVVAGIPGGALVAGENGDTFVRAYSSSGDSVWTRQFGGESNPWSIRSSGDGYLIAGVTADSLDGVNQGSADAIVYRLDANGQPIWVRQWGTAGYDFGYSAVATPNGNVYLSGAVWRYDLEPGYTEALLWEVEQPQ